MDGRHKGGTDNGNGLNYPGPDALGSVKDSGSQQRRLDQEATLRKGETKTSTWDILAAMRQIYFVYSGTTTEEIREAFQRTP